MISVSMVTRIRSEMIFALLFAAFLVNAASGADWKADERMVATVELGEGVHTLKDVCSALRSQITAEIYVDRRFEDREIVAHAGPITLKTAMEAIELASGLKWRSVGDMFFLCRDLQGEAVGRWYERYEQAKRAHIAGLTERRAKEWLSEEMPFAPLFDPPWNLTPLQREQLAYEGRLSVYSMTMPQLDWLEDSLNSKGYQTGQALSAVDRLAQVSPDLPVKLSVGLAIESRTTSLLVELPLAFSEPETKDEEREPPAVEPQPSDSEDEPPPAVRAEMKAMWIEDGDLRDLSDLLKKAGKSGVRDVFVPVFELGHSIYPSAHFPQKPEYKGTDVLSAILRTARDVGINVHAVVNATLWGDAKHPVPAAANRPIAFDRNLTGRTYAEQERWQKSELAALEQYGLALSGTIGDTPTDDAKVYLCPASSLVPTLTRTVVVELASRYPVAGICIKGADYPRSTPFRIGGQNLAPPFGYTEEVRREMIRANHVDPIDVDAELLRTEADMEAATLWDQFRRGRLTNLVRETFSQYRSVKKTGIGSVVLSLESKSQSPSQWSRIEGLDLLMPEIQIRPKVDDEGYAYGKEETEAISSLQAGILKKTALVPIIRGIEIESLPDQVGVLAALVKLAKDAGLKGYAVSGDTRTLSSVLDVLGEQDVSGQPATVEEADGVAELVP